MSGHPRIELKIPLEILLGIFEVVDSPKTLLSLALTCKTLRDIIIPDYLYYFRIHTTIADDSLWNDFLQKPHLFRNVREFELVDSIQRTYYTTSVDNNPTGNNSRRVQDPEDHVRLSNLRQIVQSMVGLRRVKIKIGSLAIFQHVSDALVDSKCTLEELDVTFKFRPRRRFRAPVGQIVRSIEVTSIPRTREMFLGKLQIWSKLNLTSLRKVSIQFALERSRINHAFIGRKYIIDFLSNAQGLTHLRLSFLSEGTFFFPNLFDCTWPNLENIVVNHIILRDTTSDDQPESNSKWTAFFRRHSKLTTVALPYDTGSPSITVVDMPNLKSFSNHASDQMPLSRLITPALARRLQHLTICEKDSILLFSEKGIYKELESLKTCCITSERNLPADYQNINRILENFIAYVTNLQKIHLPAYQINQNYDMTDFFETLSLLQCLPNLTHLSGVVWNDSLSRAPEADGSPSLCSERLSCEWYNFFRLQYIIPVTVPLPGFTVRNSTKSVPFVLRLARDRRKKCVTYEPVSDPTTIRECDSTLWGGFYGGGITQSVS